MNAKKPKSNDVASAPRNKNRWIKRHKKQVIVISAIGAFLLASATTAYFFTREPDTPPQITQKPTPRPTPKPEKKYFSPLTGAQVDNEAATQRAVTAVMIENSPDARPQSGLKESGVVFEAIAEGGITRFLALYQNEQPELIGPVRSLRMYYVDWLAPFNASVAHVGGSYNALQEVRNGSYRDIDQFFNAGSYWRASDRWAPHNVYTNFERLNALNTAKGYTTSSFTGFTRGDSDKTAAPTARDISVHISSSLYNSHYKYNTDSNLYDRSQGGAPHTDREKGQISPRVVIVMEVQQHTVMEDGWREEIKAIGSGVAHIFQDGTVTKATWTKQAKESQLTFTDETGKTIPLARGQTWLTAVPAGRGGVSWQ